MAAGDVLAFSAMALAFEQHVALGAIPHGAAVASTFDFHGHSFPDLIPTMTFGGYFLNVAT
jgi:hypothetical protein